MATVTSSNIPYRPETGWAAYDVDIPDLASEINTEYAGGTFATGDQVVRGPWNPGGHVINIASDLNWEAEAPLPTVDQTATIYRIAANGTRDVDDTIAYLAAVAPDTEVPVITLLGDASVTITEGDVYNDAGATASDNVDGNITANIVTVNPVNSSVVGSYTITYNVSDAAGNNAVEVTRTVIVEAAPDTTIPVITLLGDAVVTLTEGDPYTDAGATATDDTDGNITGSIVTVNPVDVNTVGTYTVTYNVDDAAGNSAVQVSRTVNVVSASVDMIPDAFDLGLDVVDAEPTTITQRQFTVTGIDVGQTVTLTALGSATLSASTADVNDMITVSLTSGTFDAVVSGGVDINGVSDTFSITTRSAVLPSVQTQPTNQTVEEGESTTFTAGFTNAVSYQWFDASDDSAIVGATSVAYTFTTVLADNANSYYCVATSADGATVQTNTVTLTVTAIVVVQAPVMPADTTVTVAENTTAVGTFVADSGDAPITYSLGGTDAGSFSIGSTTGVVAFLVAPDYETRTNYAFTVTASNAGGTDSQEITVAVSNILDTLPVINTGNVLSTAVRVGGLYSDPAWTASDEVGDVTLTWSGTVDTNTAGTYTRTATATNSEGTVTQDFTIQVTEEPTIDFIPALLQTDRNQVTVFKDRGNRFRVTLSHDNAPIDLSLFTSFELYGLTDTPISGVAFDWNDGNGVINITAGDHVEEFGKFKTTLVGYHNEYPDGVVLWHPTLTNSRVTVTVL